MSKKTNTLTALLLMAFTLATGAISADSNCYAEPDCCYEECNPCGGLPGKVGVSLEFLWWKACINDLDYAISFDGNVLFAPTAAGKYECIDHQWAPGLRAGLFVENIFCNLDFQFSYTWMHNTKGGVATGPAPGEGVPPAVQSTLMPVQLPPIDILVSPVVNPEDPPVIISSNLFYVGFEASHSYRYQTFEGLFRGKYDLNCCSFFNPFFGVVALKLDQSWRSSSISTLTPEQLTALGPLAPSYTMRWNSAFETAGLKFGADYTYKLTCDIDFYTSAAAMVTAGYDHWDYNFKATPIDLLLIPPPGEEEPFNITQLVLLRDFQINEQKRHLVCSPGIHLKTGFSSTSTILGPETSMFIGYEFVNWWNTPTMKQQTLGVRDSGNRFGAHGLYAGLSIKI